VCEAAVLLLRSLMCCLFDRIRKNAAHGSKMRIPPGFSKQIRQLRQGKAGVLQSVQKNLLCYK
jgi:hypothetical protein